MVAGMRKMSFRISVAALTMPRRCIMPTAICNRPNPARNPPRISSSFSRFSAAIRPRASTPSTRQIRPDPSQPRTDRAGASGASSAVARVRARSKAAICSGLYSLVLSTVHSTAENRPAAPT